MRIVEQAFRVKERTRIVNADHPVDSLFQVFVKGRLQEKETYKIVAETLDFGFDCLVPGDIVQLFFLIP